MITATINIDPEAVSRTGTTFAGAVDAELADLRRDLLRQWRMQKDLSEATYYGYTLDELHQIIEFAESEDFPARMRRHCGKVDSDQSTNGGSSQ